MAAARAPEPGDEGYDPFEAFDRSQGSEAMSDPYPIFTEVLAECPVHHGSMEHRFGIKSVSDKLAGGRPVTSVYSYSGAETVLRDGETFSASVYEESMGKVMGHTILEMDEPEHGIYRALIQHAFSRREMDRWENEIVHPVMNHYIDAFADRGRADLVSEFTFMFPIHVISMALGLPESDLPAFYRRTVELINMAAEMERGFAASQWLYDYLEPVVKERRVNPQDDLLSVLIKAELPDGKRLTDDEVIGFGRLLLPTGAETTFRSSSNMMLGLLSHPDQFEAVQNDRSLVDAVVEETLRWETPITLISRMSMSDTELEGEKVAAGAFVDISLGSANHDPSRWDNPERFDIFRDKKIGMSFGAGVHLCLGINLARMQMRVVLDKLTDRLPGLRLDPDAETPAIVGLGLRSPAALPVVWDV